MNTDVRSRRTWSWAIALAKRPVAMNVKVFGNFMVVVTCDTVEVHAKVNEKGFSKAENFENMHVWVRLAMKGESARESC